MSNNWNTFCKVYASEHGISYKEALTKYHTDLSSDEYKNYKKFFLDDYIKKVKEKFL